MVRYVWTYGEVLLVNSHVFLCYSQLCIVFLVCLHLQIFWWTLFFNLVTILHEIWSLIINNVCKAGQLNCFILSPMSMAQSGFSQVTRDKTFCTKLIAECILYVYTYRDISEALAKALFCLVLKHCKCRMRFSCHFSRIFFFLNYKHEGDDQTRPWTTLTSFWWILKKAQFDKKGT